MQLLKYFLVVLVVMTILSSICCLDNKQQPRGNNPEPMIATTCTTSDNPYLLQFFSLTTSSFTPHTPSTTPTTPTTPCISDKLLLLKTCQLLYPTKDITNIVETSSRPLPTVCKKTGKRVKCTPPSEGVVTMVYRCLESPFQSDALLVPSPCIFDHIHNSSSCWDSGRWNGTAAASCEKRHFRLRSYAVLLPCGVGEFTGVEFVCCPGEEQDKQDKQDKDKKVAMETEDKDSYSEEDEDEEDEDYYFDEATSTTPPTTTPPPPPPPPVDPYFSSLTSSSEHYNFKAAEARLENLHRLRMSKVMRDWEALERKYQDMKTSNHGDPEGFKKSVTLRFQKTIQNLEEEGQAEKRELVAVHQRRVLAALSSRKKESMECFTSALASPEQNPNKIRKCLEKLMRILHKDRTHTLTHYKHLVKNSPEQAEKEREYTLARLVGVSASAREALEMVGRYPALAKLIPLIQDYVLGLTGREEVGESLLSATEESDRRGLQGPAQAPEQTARPPTLPALEQEKEMTTSTSTPMETTDPPLPLPLPEMKNLAGEIKEQLTSVRRTVFISSKPLYFTLIFAGIAVFGAFLVGILVLVKRRVIDHPRNHGFLQVNQALSGNSILKSPEEKHVANMQINGYENPTYKYFEQNT